MCVFLCSYQPMWFKPISKRYTPFKARLGIACHSGIFADFLHCLLLVLQRAQ